MTHSRDVGGGFFGQVLDTDSREKAEVDLIRRYREISQQPECDSAIDDIVNEAFLMKKTKQYLLNLID